MKTVFPLLSLVGCATHGVSRRTIRVLCGTGLALGISMPGGWAAPGTVAFANHNGSRITNVYTGNPIAAAANVQAALYWSPLGTSNFVQLGGATSVGVPVPGVFAGGTRTCGPQTPAFSTGQFQVRAWSGGATNYEQALLMEGVLAGKSSIIQVQTGGNPLDYPFFPPVALWSGGFQGFALKTNDSPPVQLKVDDKIAHEHHPDLIAQFSIERLDTSGPLTVDFAFVDSNLTNGAATLGRDYTAVPSNSVSFSNGEASKKVVIIPINDSEIEPPESITLNLLSSSNYTLFGPTNGLAALYDDEKPQLGVCFRDDFDTPTSATNWNLLYTQNGGTNVEIPEIVFGYDYVAAGIPPAPGTSTNYGLKLAFTNTALNVPAVVNLFHSLNDCSPNWYALSFDLYLQYNATNSLPLHAMAGINADPTNANFVFQSPFAIQGSGQFVTLVGNDTTNTAMAGARLWSPGYSPTNALTSFSPGPIANQLVNNPPYGANGGSPGVFGCDVNSTNKGWLRCQMFQLGDLVRLKINGYTAFEAVVTNAQSAAAANGISPGGAGGSMSTTNGPIMLGYLQMLPAPVTLPEYYAIFDNVELTPLSDKIVLTAMAIEDDRVFLNFYSKISDNINDYRILSSTSFADLNTTVYPSVRSAITIPGFDTAGWFGALLNDAFYITTNARFFQVRGTNRNAKVTAP